MSTYPVVRRHLRVVQLRSVNLFPNVQMTPYYLAGFKFLIVLPVRISLGLHFFQGLDNHAFYKLTTKKFGLKNFFATTMSTFQAIINLTEKHEHL